MTPFFSIITPVYNAERYISKCVESVISQTLPDFELLLVDDGSLDNSGRICDEYAIKDIRIKVFHKKNGGVSSARNYGLDVANGKYILFLDSDDFFMQNTLMHCKKIIKREEVDILQFSIQGVAENGEFTNKTTIKRESTNVVTPEKYILDGQLQVCAGGSCIKREIIEKHSLRFKQNIKLAEDQLFIISSILYSKKVKFDNIILYNYLDNPQSATHINKSQDVIESIKEIKIFIKENPLSKEILNRQILNFICILLRNRDISFDKISDIVEKKTFKYSKELRIGEKVFCILSKINFRLSCHIVSLLFAIYYPNRK